MPEQGPLWQGLWRPCTPGSAGSLERKGWGVSHSSPGEVRLPVSAALATRKVESIMVSVLKSVGALTESAPKSFLF